MRFHLILFTVALMAGFSFAATLPPASNQPGTKSAETQSTEAVDVELTREIRAKIIEHRELSMAAHNVKIITENGQVLLKGPVKSKREKVLVGRIARGVASNTPVINETYVEK